jgi:uncharacterized membrane protein
MSLRIESSVPWLIVALAPALALTAGGCGDDFESCEARRMCPSGGKAGAAGSGGAAGSAGAALGGGGNAGTGGGGSGTGGEPRGGASGTSGGVGGSGKAGSASGNAGDTDSGGTAGRVGAAGEGGGETDSGSGGEGGDAEPPDPCDSLTCEHGVCANVDGEGTCECESGFTGTRCELPTFEWIEPLPGHDYVDPYILSEDGTTVLGTSCCGDTGTWFRWTHKAGSSALGGSEIRDAYGTNRDASVVVGRLGTTGHAFRWTEASGSVSLGVLPGGDASSWSSASDVSSDGSVVVGSSTQGPFRWTSETGMVKLGMPPEAPSDSGVSAIAVSSDGSIIAGNLSHASASIVRWTQTGEVEWIEPSRHAQVTGMSADGEVIVGNADFAGVSEAFRWTRLGGIVSLGRPAACTRGTYGVGVSGDGRVVAVTCLSFSQSYLWDVDNGFRSVQYVLESIGADISQAGFLVIKGLSFDGSTITGDSGRAWIARLPPLRD